MLLVKLLNLAKFTKYLWIDSMSTVMKVKSRIKTINYGFFFIVLNLVIIYSLLAFESNLVSDSLTY